MLHKLSAHVIWKCNFQSLVTFIGFKERILVEMMCFDVSAYDSCVNHRAPYEVNSFMAVVTNPENKLF